MTLLRFYLSTSAWIDQPSETFIYKSQMIDKDMITRSTPEV